MKRSISFTRLPVLAVAFLFTSILSSFSINHGGEGFEVFLGNKLLLQQFGQKMNTVKTIQLDKKWNDSQLSIAYYHCGKQGLNRVITAKDASGKLLKQWKFADASLSAINISPAAMSCNVKDILRLQKTYGGKISIYYQSSELPAGRLLLYLAASAD